MSFILRFELIFTRITVMFISFLYFLSHIKQLKKRSGFTLIAMEKLVQVMNCLGREESQKF